MSLTKKNAYLKAAQKGCLDMLPLSLSVIPWGILCGSLAIARGFTELEAFLMVLLVFAGSVQLVVIELMSSGTPLTTVLFSAFIISSRHFLYGLVLRDKIKNLPCKYRIGIGFLLTDELFALSAHNKALNGKRRLVYALSAGASFYVCWITWNVIGIIAGNYMPDLTSLGLDFAIAVTFISLVIPSITNLPMLVTALTAGFLSVTFKLLHFQLDLVFASVLAMTAGFFTSELLKRSKALKVRGEIKALEETQ
ncbi:AzlC family ABC transporter permease [Psychromonas ossibalaenae]|uniref:AzlC family ABC transporter permease n=1 Tax=Psychromonas ossibalaenae TaxID=444922 RepID=UPI0003659D77|nr:AzlC family ABC transporter permease [Psychromonas ossibalaenae]